MSADKLLERIGQDARDGAAEIREQALERARKQAQEIEQAAKEQADQIIEKARFDAQEIERRRMLIAGLEARKSTLASKREVVDKAFALALEELNELSDERWEALITRIVLEGCETGRERLRVPARDAERYQSSLLTKISAKIGGEGSMLDRINTIFEERKKIRGALTLDEQPAHFAGGVQIIGEKSDVNGSFEELLRTVREQCEREVSALLFDSEV